MDVDLQPEESSKSPKPHEFLWFSDGNVVLATDTHLFKVHKSLLSLHSSVFKDMFDFPNVDDSIVEQSSNSGAPQEMHEGLPLVILIGDKGEDVAHVLQVVYDRNYYHCEDDSIPLNVIVALLLLSTKYDFEGIQKDVIVHISRQYPKILQEFDAVDDGLPRFGEARLQCNFRLLAAALTADVDVLLPSLFFVCSDNQVEVIWDQCQAYSIPLRHLRNLLMGREALDYRLGQLTSDLPERLREEVASSTCGNKESCLKKACYSELSCLIQPYFFQTKGPEVVRDFLSPVCTVCNASVAKSIDQRREVIWREIPSFYGFSDWGASK